LNSQPAALTRSPEAFDQAALPPAEAEPPASTERSFLLPGLHFSESIDADQNASPVAATRSVTRALGSLELFRIWKHARSSAEYVGGEAIYSDSGRGDRQLQQLQADQSFLWRTGKLALHDSFSFLPDGSFGNTSFGGAAGYEASGLGGLTPGLGASGSEEGASGFEEIGTLGRDLRLNNVTMLALSQEVTPRSAATISGAYGLLHFTGNTRGLIDSQLASAQASYSYKLGHRDEIGFASGFQDFHYPRAGVGGFESFSERVQYSRQISGHLQFAVSGGPQLVILHHPGSADSHRVAASGHALLTYHFVRTTLSVSYNRHITSGSGFFAGATSDIARFIVQRPVRRRWEVTADLGYARSGRIQPGISGVNSGSYQFGYAGAGVHHEMGRHLRAFFSYQFSGIDFGGSQCSVAGAACGQFAQRHIATMGLDWHPKAIPLD